MNTNREGLWLAAAMTVLLGGCGAGTRTAGERADLFTVLRGDLPIQVTEQAEIQPFTSTRIKNEMEGRSTIIYLIAEGTVVDQGDKLVELDSSELLERKAQQEIALHRADAARLEAREELSIREKEFVAEKLGGENTVRIAEIDMEKFLGKALPDGKRDMGEREQQLVDAQANIELAQQELKLAKNKLEWSDKLFEKGFITKDDLERDQLDHQRRQKNVRVAENELDILVKFTHPKEQIQLEQGIREANTGLEGIVARGNARLAQARADLEAKEKEYQLALERFENLERQIQNSVIRAPTPGLVVYASDGDGFRGRQEFVEEGAEVRERQTLIELPDVTRMIATLKVHEAEVDKVRVGQRATIRADAFNDREFTGFVRRVSPVADSGSRWSNSALKVYKTEIEIEGVNSDLKPGMSAAASIVVAELHDVLYVPLQSVRTQGTVNFVWLETRDGPVARKVERGLNDKLFVEIVDGLSEHDQVYLAPPPGAVEPEFPQPKPASQVAQEGPPEQAGPADAGSYDGPPAAAPRGEGAGPGEGGPAPREDGDGGASAGGSARQSLMRLLEERYPALAKVVESDRSAWFDNEELRRAFEEDDELRQARDAWMQQMREGRGRGRDEENGERRRGRRGGPGAAGGEERDRDARDR